MSTDADKLKAEIAQLRRSLEQANVATAVLRQQRESANDAAAQAHMTVEMQARQIAELQKQIDALKAPAGKRAS